MISNWCKDIIFVRSSIINNAADDSFWSEMMFSRTISLLVSDRVSRSHEIISP